MNINPEAKRILCFGDSNLWGRIPGDNNSARYPANVRWTGVLQKLLGDNYEIIEEGLNGRTTDKESPFKNGKNGVKYLYSCLESQNPLDLVVLSLGKNDLKAQYNETPESIGRGIEECIQVIKSEGKDKLGVAPKILLLNPAIIEEKERVRFGKKVVDFQGGNKKSKKLVGVYQNISTKHKAHFFDVSKSIKVSGVDGVHLDEVSHQKLAESLFRIVKMIFA